MKRKNKKNLTEKDLYVIDAINAMKRAGLNEVQSDVQGSYRGVGADDSHPIQDADDL